METHRVLSACTMMVVMLMSGCHRHQVIPDSLKAHVNQAVTFDQEPDPRDPSRSRAKNVRLAEAEVSS